jgi:hypothetical protein
VGEGGRANGCGAGPSCEASDNGADKSTAAGAPIQNSGVNECKACGAACATDADAAAAPLARQSSEKPAKPAAPPLSSDGSVGGAGKLAMTAAPSEELRAGLARCATTRTVSGLRTA